MRVKVRDGLWIEKGDFIAVYDNLAALHYVPDRPQDPTKVVHGVSVVEDLQEFSVKPKDTGWWHINTILRITKEQYERWLCRHNGRNFIDNDEARKESACPKRSKVMCRAS